MGAQEEGGDREKEDEGGERKGEGEEEENNV
jgi:hypothetical protein